VKIEDEVMKLFALLYLKRLMRRFQQMSCKKTASYIHRYLPFQVTFDGIDILGIWQVSS
jgi:hypothetical protein